MLLNYLKIAIRNLKRYKSYSIISISGLTLGLTCCLSILLYVQHELSYDRFHAKNDRIYRLVTGFDDDTYDGIAKVHGPWGTTALHSLAEIENMTRFVIAGQTLFSNEDLMVYENDGLIADSTVFDIFDFKIIHGNPKTALTQPNGIAISESISKKYFGEENSIGNTIKLNNEREVIVTAILEDIPDNSHLKFTFLLPMSGYDHPQKDSWVQWNQFYTYLLLKEGQDPRQVARKFGALLPSYMDNEAAQNFSPFLQSLTDIHLRSNLFRELQPNSDIDYIYIFSGIGLLILIISSINFINLTTARAINRMKEVGIRKSSGAIKSQLITQYLSESIVVCLVSLLLAVGILYAALPYFNTIIGKKLFIDISNYENFMWAILITLAVGIISGSYPAFYLANQRPTDVLKGKSKSGGRQLVRKSLVVIQFAVSVFLIISSIAIYQQLNFIQKRKLGFNPSQLVTIPIQNNTLRQQQEVIKNELVRNSAIVSTSISGGQPGGSDWGIPYAAEGISEDELPPMRVLAVDHDFANTFEMDVVQGRNFSKEISSDSIAYLVNEEAVRQLGWDDPLNKSLSMPAIGRPPGPIVGVLKDFHFRSLKEKIGPVLLFIPPSSWFGMYTIRIRANHMENGIDAIEQTFKKFDPDHPFTYSFFDETYGQLYQAENRLAKIVRLFTGIGIFIACMGLFSLASFMTEQRIKEIGIRKVMGASVKSITLMLTKDLLLLVFIGLLIAIPVGYYLIENWLSAFVYRITLGSDVFILTGLFVIVLSWATISYRIVQAGLMNPVDSLRNE